MSTASFEESIESDWKILINATQKASKDELRQRKNRPRKSYEEFVEEIKQTKRNSSSASIQYCNEENDANDKNDFIAKHEDVGEKEDIRVLGDWKSDDEEFRSDESRKRNKNEMKVIKKKNGKCGKGYFLNENSSSRDYEGSVSNARAYIQKDESSWESISSSSDDDVNLNEFLKFAKDSPRKDNDSMRWTGYTNLTQCLINHYCPETEDILNNNQQNQNPSKTKGQDKNDDYQKEDFNRNGQLSLEERLPLMQALETLNDVSKVLKAGKITPRMERVLEYKQDYPFTEGYQEERLGWCPWLVYKLERLCKRISDKQWPN